MKQISSILGVLGGLLFAIAGLSYLITQELTLLYQVIGFAGIVLVFIFIYFHIDELIETFGSRSARYSWFALLLISLCLAVLGLINFIAFRHPQRYDATEDKLFSLSPQTIQVVQKLKGPVQLTTFFLADSEARAKFEDLIDGFTMHSDKLKVTYIDPEKNPTAVRQFGVTAADTVVVAMGENEKRLTTISEEALTNALVQISRETQKQVCFLEGHGEKSSSSTEKEGMTEAKAALEKQAFQISTVQLFQTQKVPETCSVLVVPGPTRALLDPEKPVIEAWVQGGGRMIFLLDPAVDPALAEYLKSWGIEAHADLVVDPVAQSFFGNAAVPVGVPAGPHKITENFKDAPVFFPLARSLRALDTIPLGGFVENLLQTASDQAWGETDLSLLEQGQGTDAPRAPAQDANDIKGPLTLAALMTLPPEQSTAPGAAPDATPKKPQGMVLVFGDSDFASNAYFNSSINGDLFMNAVSFLAEEEDLISIRPKEAGKQTLSMTQAQGSFVAYMSLLIMPAVPLLLGIYTFMRKRNL